AGQLVNRSAKVRSKGRVFFLVPADVVLGDEGDALDVPQRFQLFRVKTGFLPLPPVKGRALPGIIHLLLQFIKNDLFPLFYRHRLLPAEPVRLVGRGTIRAVIYGRPRHRCCLLSRDEPGARAESGQTNPPFGAAVLPAPAGSGRSPRWAPPSETPGSRPGLAGGARPRRGWCRPPPPGRHPAGRYAPPP